MKQTLFGDEARSTIQEGFKLLYDAVSVTLSPLGLNGILSNFGFPQVTHDGVTVANAVEISSESNPGVKLGVELIKDAARKTAKVSGDGTTTTTILAYHLLDKGNEAIRSGKNPMVLRREINESSEEAISILKELAAKIKDNQITQIATISAQDEELGKLVGELFIQLGEDAVINTDISHADKTTSEIVEGYTFDKGLTSLFMVTDQKKRRAVLEDVPVLVCEEPPSIENLDVLVKKLYDDGDNQLAILSNDFTNEFLSIVANIPKEFKVVCINSPGYADNRLEILGDIATYCGTTVQTKNSAIIPELSKVKKIVTSVDSTTLINDKDVFLRVEELQEQLNKDISDYDKHHIEERIAKLNGKVGIIKVGAPTLQEANEARDRLEDAIPATRVALKHGIVPGGASAFVEISKRLTLDTDGAKIFKETILEPFRVLMNNAGLRSGVKINEITKFGEGFDVHDPEKKIILIDKGIIDPEFVLEQSINNAISVATTAMTAGVVIVDEKEPETIV